MLLSAIQISGQGLKHPGMGTIAHIQDSPPCDDVLTMPPDGSDFSWHCLHSLPRREKRVAEICRTAGVPHYLPVRRSVKSYGNRRREHTIPYFPGYVFCCLAPWRPYELVATGHVVRAIRVHEQDDLLRDLRRVRDALQVAEQLETFPYIRQGQPVRIVRGPFRGVEGVVSERRKGFRVVLNVHFIQRALAIEADVADVEPLEPCCPS